MASSSTTSTDFERFGAKIYSTVSQQQNGQNIFLSPASIALAMSMCSAGARAETLNQMLHALEVSSIEDLTKTAEQVMRVFAIAGEDKQVQLKLANRLYAQKAYKLQEEYLNLVRTSFQADIKLEDFEHESAKAVQTINAWVEEKTNKLIRNLLSPNDVDSDTRLIIVNCIYFKGTWVKQFKENATDQNAIFHEANGSTSKIKLMYQKEKYAYADNEQLGVQIAHLPYKSDNKEVQFVFTIILPKQHVRLDDVEQKLTSEPELMQQLLSHEGTTTQELLLHIPKFKMESTFQLNDVLVKLGMHDAFNGSKADFTGIVSKEDDRAGLCISKVIHKAFIDVNEQGSEAAAATAVIMCNESCMIRRAPDPVLFKADRPFLFYIRESRQNLTLFTGKFVTSTRSEAAAATAGVKKGGFVIVSRKADPIEFKADRPFVFYIREIRQNLTLLTGKFVTSKRSEAAAATAVIMSRCCAMVSPKAEPIEFKADRPFLFFIRESRQNIVLFSGKFVSPPTAN